jgi:3-deoxy-D-manno-octulosonic-acid transferase
MKKIIRKVINLFRPLYKVVYTTKDGRTEMYTISAPRHRNEFGNVTESLRTAGFRAYCYNRNAIRSFRYDRIVSINKG